MDSETVCALMAAVIECERGAMAADERGEDFDTIPYGEMADTILSAYALPRTVYPPEARAFVISLLARMPLVSAYLW